MKRFGITTGLAALVLVASTALAQRQQPQRIELAPPVVEPATEEMQKAEFWISRIQNPDRVILTPSQINALNRKNEKRPFDLTDYKGQPFSFLPTVVYKDSILGIQFQVDDPLALKSLPGDSLRARLIRHRNSFHLENLYDRRQVKFDDREIREIDGRVNLGAVPGVVRPRYGILVSHTLNRALPTNSAVHGSASGWLDMIQSTALDMASPVAVLHASPDRDWLYVRSELAFGWVPAANVAFGVPKEIGDYASAKDFIVSLAHTVPVFADAGFGIFLADFYLGERIKLIRKSDKGYEVSVPVRKPDGNVAFVPGWLRPDAKVSVGYQAYTQRNVLNTIFGLLYRPYGWADELNERDCCGTQRSVLRTCGIMTGRWTTHELHSSDHVAAFPRKTPKEDKYAVLDACEPGITLVGDPGHISMYLGKVDGKYFVIHQSGYFYTDKEGVRRLVGRVNVNDTELEGGSNVNQWSEIMEMKP